MNEEFLTIKEYAAQNGVSTRTVQRWLRAGLIFGVKIKGRIYIPADEPSPRLLDTGKYAPDEDEITGGGGGIKEPPEEIIDDGIIDGGEDECDEPCGCDTPEGVEIRSHDDFKSSDLRISFVVYEDAVAYAEPIIPPTEIFRRIEDCRYQVVLVYP